MEKTSIELQDEIIAMLKAENPTESHDIIYARFLGALLAHTPKSVLQEMIEIRTRRNLEV